MKRLLYIAFCLLISFGAWSQTRKRNFRQHEIGIFVGGAYYIGDLNPNRQFFLSQPAGGILYRFTPNYRYAFRAGINFGNIMGDDSQSEDADQRQRNLNFKSRVYEFYTVAEFNFLEYRISNDKHRFSTYLFLGLGVFNFNPLGNLGGGDWVALQPLRTEGEAKKYRLWQLSIPFGIGWKLNVSKRLGIGFEWGPRKTFTDYLDDVSGTYPDLAKNPPNGERGILFSNRSRYNGDVTNMQRGNPRNKDWYFFYGLTLNIKLNPRKEPCYATGM
ncbi:MAG: type IX secretion system protein PorG [Bacteroidia bacterium]